MKCRKTRRHKKNTKPSLANDPFIHHAALPKNLILTSFLSRVL
jgi:hypothetical protein